MSADFEPRLDILPESQLRLWPELDAVPSEFVLYGGTALALQIGHRFSEDFDFFSSYPFDPARLQSTLPFFQDLDPSDPDAWVHHKPDNLEAFVDRGGLVKLPSLAGLIHCNGSRIRGRPWDRACACLHWSIWQA